VRETSRALNGDDGGIQASFTGARRPRKGPGVAIGDRPGYAMIDIIYRCEMLDVPARPRPTDATAAALRLSQGNREFAALLDESIGANVRAQRIVPVDPHDWGLFPADLTPPDHRPFAAILGCSDARVPIELIFGEGPNDLFVIRVAGNNLGAEVLGSLNYAIDHLSDSLTLIAVLGHSGCGAVTAAVDVFLNPAGYLRLATKHSLRNILDSLLVVVQASAERLRNAFGPDVARRPGYRTALIEASIVANAALCAYSIQKEIGAAGSTALQTVFGVYQLDSRVVWAPRIGEMRGIGLAAAPRDEAEFVELGYAILRSDRIASLIDREA
jgi:carbonic anhydrase